jgi:hypothetical protein
MYPAYAERRPDLDGPINDVSTYGLSEWISDEELLACAKASGLVPEDFEFSAA